MSGEFGEALVRAVLLIREHGPARTHAEAENEATAAAAAQTGVAAVAGEMGEGEGAIVGAGA